MIKQVTLLVAVVLISGFTVPSEQASRFRPQVCWTEWFNRDAPSGTGDWETLKDLKKENPGKICDRPYGIKVFTADGGMNAENTGQIFFANNPGTGFICRNQDQTSGSCLDYKVSFACPECFS